MVHIEIILPRAAVGWGRPAKWDGWGRVVQDRGIDGMERQLGLARLLARGAIVWPRVFFSVQMRGVPISESAKIKLQLGTLQRICECRLRLLFYFPLLY
jgi:hypothetical protein